MANSLATCIADSAALTFECTHYHLRGILSKQTSLFLNDSHIIKRCDIDVKEKIGEGAFGTVFKAKWGRRPSSSSAAHSIIYTFSVFDRPTNQATKYILLQVRMVLSKVTKAG